MGVREVFFIYRLTLALIASAYHLVAWSRRLRIIPNRSVMIGRVRGSARGACQA